MEEANALRDGDIAFFLEGDNEEHFVIPNEHDPFLDDFLEMEDFLQEEKEREGSTIDEMPEEMDDCSTCDDSLGECSE